MSDDEHQEAGDRPARFGEHRQELLFKGYRPLIRHDGVIETAHGPLPVARDVYEVGTVAAVVAYDPERDIVVLHRQFRFPVHLSGLDAVIVELPAGLIEPGETAEAAARREMVEEIGLPPLDVVFGFSWLPSPGSLGERAHLFVARVDAGHVPKTAGKRSEAEFTEPFAIEVDKVLAAIDADRLSHGFTIIGMLWFARHRARLMKLWGFEP